MKLSALHVPANQTNIEGTVKEEGFSEGIKNGMKEIASKTPGQTLSGEVVSKNGNEVIISIGKNQLLKAALESGAQVEQGSRLSFAIKSMAGSKVVLSPLFANTGNNPNVTRALQMAGIPETAGSVKMVQSMMREGMSIDKASLQQMMRSVNLFPSADADTLVQLTKLNIPITDESIFQMNAYKNYEHQMTESLLTMADALTETVQQMAAEGKLEEGLQLYKEMLGLLTEDGEEGLITGREQTAIGKEGAEASSALPSAGLSEGETTKVLLDMLAKTAKEGESAQQLQNMPKEAVLNGQEKEALTAVLKQTGYEQLGEAFLNGQISEKEVFSMLSKNILSNTAVSAEQMEMLRKLFDNEGFQKLLKNEMKDKWMLTPEEVSEEKKVDKLYERLNEQMSRISKAAEQAAQQNSPLGRAASNVAGNIDFMNHLNQMFTYVQIPLKLQGQDANGELYVYTNKKNLAQKEGAVSALLHLDMEHLGSVDVHVSMENQKVATQFYLQDDKALDLIMDNIELLNERLTKRGYSMTASFTKREEAENIVEEMIKQDKEIAIVSSYSFDARA